ncbi:MAG: response regulator [Xanthomonadales bacterium]|nr:response regulator [Xanthomonadales bacterium]
MPDRASAPGFIRRNLSEGVNRVSIFDSVKRWRDTIRGRETPVEAAPAPIQAPTPQRPPTPTPEELDALADAATPEALVEAALAQPILSSDLYEGPERREKSRGNVRPGTRVLIVDDSTTIVAVLRKMLQQNGFQTLEAYTAEDALEMTRDLTPDLIFLDIVLPGMDGFAALRALRRQPSTKLVPIIMISGNVQATEQFYVQRIGADDFMKKPFSRPEVFARIDRLLDEEGVPRRAPMVGVAMTVPTE